jgi:dTDP-4-amino-4,6-dideoxygalactose transaminase
MARYVEQLPSDVVPVVTAPLADAVHHLAVVRVEDRPGVCRKLDERGIGWGLHYPVPCHQQPAFSQYADGPLPVAEAAAGQILSLPMSPTLTDAQVDQVCEALTAAVAVRA